MANHYTGFESRKVRGAKVTRSFSVTGTQLGFSLNIAILFLATSILYFSVKPLNAAVIGLSCCLASLGTLALYSWPLALSIRMCMLAIPGVLTGALILAYGNERGVMVHVTNYHTYGVASRVLLLTALALASSSAAWVVAGGVPMRKAFRFPEGNVSYRYAFYAVVAIVAGTLNAKSLGPYVWKAAYMSEGEQLFLNLGAIPAIAAIGVLGMYGIILTKPVSRRGLVFFGLVALYVLVNCMLLRGMRLEVFAVGIAMYAGYHMKHKLRVRPLRILVAMALLFLLSQTLGALRSISGTDITPAEAVSMGIRIVESDSTNLNFQLGTFADIAATFYNTVGLCDDGIIKPRMGRTYLEFIPRTLPEVIYPDRPGDQASIIVDSGLTSGGGIFELAEAYLNFGVAGCIIVPFLITYMVARLHLHAKNSDHFTAMMAYLVIVSLFFRGIWYQTFALYKSTITWLTIEVAFFAAIAFSKKIVIFKRTPNEQ